MLTEGNSLEEATDVVSSYITFYTEMLVPKKTMRVFLNNTPWITKSLKTTLNAKKLAFKSGNKQVSKIIQNGLNKEIKAAKRAYKDRVERLFNNGRARDAGAKTLAGLLSTSSSTGLPTEAVVRMAEELNTFYSRLDHYDYTKERMELTAKLLSIAMATDNLQLLPAEIENKLRRIKPNKAPRPDNISGRLLKACSSQIAGVFCSLFNRSLAEHSIPPIWKSSIICPVAKKSNPSSRPVALMSLVIKSFERLVMANIYADVGMLLDKLWFAYQPHRGMDDAVLTLLHGTLSHLEQPKSHVNLVFVDFSSAFNTVQPHLMGRKVLQLNANPHLILWVLSFLTERGQRVRVNLALPKHYPPAPLKVLSSPHFFSPVHQ